MTILIKSMEMPSCCDDCWALDEYGDYPVCQITEEQRGYNFRTREKRMDKCPLVPVPTPHGRLIDADALMELYEPAPEDVNEWEHYTTTISVIRQNIKDAPTVIEAEE